jgi:diguanylate cyclase (GGDEF)-like protein/PAS domain S-box-containing protein
MDADARMARLVHSDDIRPSRLKVPSKAMATEPASWQKKRTRKWLQRLWQQSSVVITASIVTGSIVGVRSLGLLQPLELAMVDQFFRLRPVEAPDPRIVIISIDETDLKEAGQWPVPDVQLARLLRSVQAAQPRVVGLDLYRNLPVGNDPKKRLSQTIESMPNLIGIEQLASPGGASIPPLDRLKQKKQIGFNNYSPDPDQTVRRSLLFWTDETTPTSPDVIPNIQESFALKIALQYLEEARIQPSQDPKDEKLMRLGKAVFSPLSPNDGVYVRVDNGGYQVLTNFRGPAGHVPSVSMSQVLKGQVPAATFRDRIVLIGSTAPSLNDVVATPYSTSLTDPPRLMSGVELQANFISQIISAALEGRPLLRSWREGVEWGWIAAWTVLGASLNWHLRQPRRSIVITLFLGGTVVAIGYGAFLLGWIIPVLPPLLGLLGVAAAVTISLAHSEEELQRSKEFLQRVIHSIPDPVFVKDLDYRWLVLNEAYAKFVGVSIDELLSRTVYDVFPKHEADLFWKQDEQVFRREQEQESEEQLTNIYGETFHIATKRSIHKDAAGNVFLVGVIRDITQRKTVEEELRRTTAELSKSNQELRESRNRLHHLANHDVLTQLPNRQLFHEKLQQAMEWAKRNQRQMAVLFLDLDGFKKVNDTLGHSIGDELLKSVAKRLTCSLRASDTVARLGGDEFTVILPAVPGIQEVERVADKILATISQPFVLEGHTVNVSTSVGIALYPTHSGDLEDLIQLADTAMYTAKQAGKSQYSIAAANPSPLAPDPAKLPEATSAPVPHLPATKSAIARPNTTALPHPKKTLPKPPTPKQSLPKQQP